MQIYKTKTKKFSGTDFREVHGPAFGLYTEIKKNQNVKRISGLHILIKKKFSLICSGIICLKRQIGETELDE